MIFSVFVSFLHPNKIVVILGVETGSFRTLASLEEISVVGATGGCLKDVVGDESV